MTTPNTTITKPTREQMDNLHAFIVDCVMNNRAYTGNNKFAVTQRMTVQDLCNSGVDTLKTIGSHINKAIQSFDPDFHEGEGLKISGIDATIWVSAIRTIINHKNYIQQLESQRSRLIEIDRDLARLETPTERKKNLQKERDNIKKQILDVS